MKKIISAALALALAGCANTYNAAPQNFQATDSQLWNITGSLDVKTGFAKDEHILSVFINGEPVINSALQNNGYSLSGSPAAIYKGHDISTDCSSAKVSAYMMEVKCLVFVDNQRAATLTF